MSISVDIFEKLRFLFKIWKNLDCGQQFRKKNRFRLKIWIISISINIFEKISISVQNFENVDFGQHI